MGKKNGKKKKWGGEKLGDGSVKQGRVGENSPRASDKDVTVLISMSQELKDEGNALFQKRDHEGAMLKYEKALKLLPRNHSDVSHLHSNMAACYMQMGLSEYPRAIRECNLALEVTPTHRKALLKRARCHEGLNRLDLALRDVTAVLNIEHNNPMASEIADRLKNEIEKRGLRVNNSVIELPLDYVAPPCASPPPKAIRGKQKKRSNKVEDRKSEDKVEEEKVEEKIEDKKSVDKVVVEEEISKKEEGPKKTVKLVFGEDIRWAQVPVNCSLLQLREVICERFPSSRAVLIKYRDQEGDLVTITSNEELRWAEASAESQGRFVRLYIVEVSPEQDPFFERFKNEEEVCKLNVNRNNMPENGNVLQGKETVSSYIDDWIIQFAPLFKNHVGFESDAFLDLHELGIKVYSEAMEETVTSEEARDLFDIAAEKFQEMASLALLNWGNVCMSRARKKVYFTEDASKQSVVSQIKTAYDWAQKEYARAGQQYEEALKIKPDFYEGFLALGQQQFERAKLSWYYAFSNEVDLEAGHCTEVLQLYNNAEDNMERGMELWEEMEEQRLSELSTPNEVEIQLQKMGLDGFKDISAEDAAEQAENMRSQINLLWGTMFYERSIVEFKLGLPVWQECLEAAVENFELAGASPTDIAVMIKTHCSSENAQEGLGLKIDEIIQAWNEMYEANNWRSGISSYRLEPLFRRRVSKLYHALEHS